jgi:hypothetical protein
MMPVGAPVSCWYLMPSRQIEVLGQSNDQGRFCRDKVV